MNNVLRLKKLKQPRGNHLNNYCHHCGHNPIFMHSSVMHKDRRIYFCNKMCEYKSKLTNIKGVKSNDF